MHVQADEDHWHKYTHFEGSPVRARASADDALAEGDIAGPKFAGIMAKNHDAATLIYQAGQLQPEQRAGQLLVDSLSGAVPDMTPGTGNDASPAQGAAPPQKAATPPPAFGSPAMRALFSYGKTYRPLNHGSYGTFPRSVAAHRDELLAAYEARPDVFKRFVYPDMLRRARALVAPLLGAADDEVVFVNNATTGINVVLRNLQFQEGHVVVYPNSIYPSCLNTLLAMSEAVPLDLRRVEIEYPLEDDDQVHAWRRVMEGVKAEGKSIKLAILDTVVSGPGVRVPWERLVGLCNEFSALSLVDGAHGIGHIDLTHVATVGPDFLVTNLHKWFYTPRGCAVLYVPFRNQHVVISGLPTSHGYRSPELRRRMSRPEYFTGLFADEATADNSPYLCVSAAMRFRNDVCGGETRIREYCFGLAQEGGERAAAILGTEVMKNASGSINQCSMVNVLLPLRVGLAKSDHVSESDAEHALIWMQKTAVVESDSFFPLLFYAGRCWVRLSAQIYLDVHDFAWGAEVLLKLCARVKDGSWKRDGHS